MDVPVPSSLDSDALVIRTHLIVGSTCYEASPHSDRLVYTTCHVRLAINILVKLVLHTLYLYSSVTHDLDFNVLA